MHAWKSCNIDPSFLDKRRYPKRKEDIGFPVSDATKEQSYRRTAFNVRFMYVSII